MELLLLFMLDIFLLFLVLFILLPSLNDPINKRIEIIRKFIDKNDGFFSIFFILLFTLEQGCLIMLIFIFDYELDILKIIISLFALIVITTASLQKIVLEIKRRYDKYRSVNAMRSIYIIKKLIKELEKK